MQTQVGGNYANAILTVNGTMVSREIIVTQQFWFDHVFANNYNLPTLEETESYLKTNKHLKDVPTTKEVIENGLNVGETEVVFLKKLEEAYLYIGDAKSEIKELMKKNEELEIRLKKLENK